MYPQHPRVDKDAQPRTPACLGCGAVHLTQSQPTRPRPSQSPLQCNPTRRSGLPGTERFMYSGQPFEPYFSAVACRVVLCRVALGLHSAPPTSCCEGQGRDLDFFRVASPSHQPSCTRRALRADSCRVAVGRWSGVSKHWIRTHSKDPSIQRIAKDSKHYAFNRI